MRLHDIGTWGYYSKWESKNGKIDRHDKWVKLSDITVKHIPEKAYAGLKIFHNGQRVGSIRRGKFLWVENLPHIYANSDAPGISAKKGDLNKKIVSLIEQIDDMTEALDVVKQVLLEMKDEN